MEPNKIKINLGCGLQCPQDWINIDSSFGVYFSKYPLIKKLLYFILPCSILPNIDWPQNTTWMELTKQFKFADNTVDVIYSSHTFEHLTHEEAKFVFSECYRVMKKGAIVRIIVPDFEVLINQYLNNRIKIPENASLIFSKNSGYFEIPEPKNLRSLFKYYIQRKNNHHFLYDEPGLKKQFSDAGFLEIKRMSFGMSRIDDLDGIESESRLNGSICIEAIK